MYGTWWRTRACVGAAKRTGRRSTAAFASPFVRNIRAPLRSRPIAWMRWVTGRVSPGATKVITSPTASALTGISSL
jgi:hypothetical protein